jgi:hypothetical protein
MCCLTVARKIVKVNIKTPGAPPPEGEFQVRGERKNLRYQAEAFQGN